MAVEAKIIYAKIVHQRITPVLNQFCYKAFYICCDINQINKFATRCFSINKFNLFSFYFKDYGAKDGTNPENWAREIFKSQRIDDISQIFLLTHPRILGWAFNPVSFYFALDNQQNLRAVIAQVNNTFGETHSYLIYNHNNAPISKNQWLEADKEFHVSPFYKVEGNYKFRFIFNDKNIAVWIDYFNNSKTLLTSLIAYQNHQLNDINLLRALLSMPLMAIKVVALIHWQALKILVKKIKYIPKPAPKNIKITINKQ